MTMDAGAAATGVEDDEEGAGGGAVEGEEDEEEDGSRGCVGPRAWVVALASVPFLAIGISLSCLGYLAPQRHGAAGTSDGSGALERHFRVLGPVFLSGCGFVFLVCIACRRPAGGRVAGTDGLPGAERGEAWGGGKGGGQQPPQQAPSEAAPTWGSCDCQCPPSPLKGGYPHVSRMVPPLLKVIPPTPESPAARKHPQHHHPLLLLTPLRLKQTRA
ncbi:uncharacterized protein LOC124173248 [Ischnura elegans]|uniref:uncharacterized protein LOC124173248 n=1 Tax=Ischnura elegans TaxID=197161 RepID=UPI001ED8927E|nr:uncharacterized protein LOC124173248 [Ischnura elegans]